MLTLFGKSVELGAIDYSRIENWVSLIYGESIKNSVDVFYVYPTVSSWETGALMTTIPIDEELEIGPYPEGVYHRFDFAMWYRNLEENVGKRIEAYLNK